MLLSAAYSVCAGTKFQVNILLMAELVHQVVYSVIYRVFSHPRWCRVSSINSTVSDPQECFVSLSHAEAGMTWNDMS